MRKISILLLAVVALLAFTASAFALHGVKEMLDYTPSVVKAKSAQVELYGNFRLRGSLSENTSDFKDTDQNDANRADDKAASYDQRVRLGMKATVSPNTQGVFELETGDTLTADGFNFGNTGGSKGVYRAAGNTKAALVSFRQAYVSHQTTALGPLAGFKAGHMLIALGNGSYYNHTQFGDDALIFWIQPADGTEIALAIIKGDENANVDNDIDIYAITVDTSTGGITLSGDISLLNDNAGTFGATDVNNTQLWNLGLRASTDLSGVGVNAGCDFQTGQIDAYKTASSDDMDFSGYQCQAGASVKVGDASVHAKFVYGSGDDIDSENDFEGFITSLSAGGNTGTFVYDNSATTAAQTPSNSATASSTHINSSTNGISNTWYLNAGATTNLTPDLSVNGEIFYLQASEEVSSNSNQDDKDIGVEVDGKVTYQIDTALAWYLEAGILFAGDFYKNSTPLNTDSPDSAWRVRQGLVFSF